MAVKKRKPTTPSNRFTVLSDFFRDHDEPAREITHRTAEETGGS